MRIVLRTTGRVSSLTRKRRGARSLVFFALAAQLMVLQPAMLLGLLSPSFVDGLECTCDHGLGAATCPMHHRTAGDDARCRMRGAGSPVLIGASIPIAVLPSLALCTHAIVSVRLPHHAQPGPAIDWLVPPDPPPPRV